MGERKIKLDNRDQELPEFYEISVEKFYETFQSAPEDARITPFYGFDSKFLKADDLFYLVNRQLHHRVSKKHVMLVGPLGCGKTTTVNNIYTSIIVYEEKRNSPERDFMVFVFDSRDYRPNETLTAIEFLQRSHRSENAMGITWNHLRKHSEKVLFVLDSLDKMLMESDRYVKTEDHDCNKSEKLSVHIFNILSGNIFPNATIFSATKPYAVEFFEGEIRPDKVVAVGSLATNVTRNMLYYYLGEAQRDKMETWEDQLPMQVVAKTPWLFRTCYDSVCFAQKFNHPRSPANVVMNFLTANLKYDRFSIYGKERVLSALTKMKSLAFFGFQEMKFAFSDEDLFEKMAFKKKDLKCFSVPIKMESGTSKALFELEKDRNYFKTTGLQEFLCALKVIEMPLKDFTPFFHKHLHTHRYSTVRQFLCGILLSKETYDEALKMMLIGSDEDESKKEVVKRSMTSQYYRVKRYNLLEFLHSVVAIGDKNHAIIPTRIDELDFSGIPLFIQDVIAIAMCLRNCKTIGFLNLGGCSLSTYAISCISNVLVEWDLKIDKLSIDRNAIEWKDAIVQSLPKMIRKCCIHHLSLNCCNVNAILLGTLHIILEGRRIKTFRVSYNSSLDLNAFTFLGHFIMRHGVQELYLHGCRLTPRYIEEMKAPRCFRSRLVMTPQGNESYIHIFDDPTED